MNHKRLTYDDRLAIQAGFQQGPKIAQIVRNIGKNRSTVSREIKACRRLVRMSKGNDCIYHCTCTRIPDCRLAASEGKNSVNQLVDGARKDAPIIRKSSVQTMKSRRLSAMPVIIVFAAVCAGCSMMPNMLSSSMNRCFLSPEKESPSQSRNWIGLIIRSHRC